MIEFILSVVRAYLSISVIGVIVFWFYDASTEKMFAWVVLWPVIAYRLALKGLEEF